MKQTLPAIIFSMGCSEYNLNRIPPKIEALSQDSDTGSNENLVTYDSCNPYDAGWAISPKGTERVDCFGIEGYAQIDNHGYLATQLYYGDCNFDLGTVALSTTTRDDGSSYEGNIGYAMGFPTKCDGAFYNIGWSDGWVEDPNELSDLSLEKNIWLLSREENESCHNSSNSAGSLTECWYEIHEPLTYVLECNEEATTLEDCIAFMY